ncbi:MAG: DUF4149 domain-containing protein [Gemmatimonadaceae bacterium]
MVAVLMAVWIGAALITAGVVAPSAFAVLPTSTLAGVLIGRVLGALFLAGIVAGVVAAVVLAAPPRAAGPSRSALIAALVVAGACGFAQFLVTPKLEQLRARIGGPVDALASGDPRRVAFGLLHGYSVAGLGLAVAGGVACLVFLSLAFRPRR